MFGLSRLIRANLGKRSDNLSNRLGCFFVLFVTFAPAIVTAYLWHSAWSALLVPVGVILLLWASAIFGKKRTVTPKQLANELERHLLGTEGKWDWDDTTSIAIADERLERIRWDLPKFDSLSEEKDKAELKAIIAALRSGSVPEIVSPKYLTYGDR